jgi:hypothetical protein
MGEVIGEKGALVGVGFIVGGYMVGVIVGTKDKGRSNKN